MVELSKNFGSQAGSLAQLLLLLAIVCLMLGGLSVLFGFRARVGSVLLMAFLIPTTLLFHDFWTASAGEAGEQMTLFLKNVGILGGLLMVLGSGAGNLSLDLFFGRRRRTR